MYVSVLTVSIYLFQRYVLLDFGTVPPGSIFLFDFGTVPPGGIFLFDFGTVPPGGIFLLDFGTVLTGGIICFSTRFWNCSDNVVFFY